MSSLFDDLSYMLSQVRVNESEPCRHLIHVLSELPPHILQAALNDALRQEAIGEDEGRWLAEHGFYSESSREHVEKGRRMYRDRNR